MGKSTELMQLLKTGNSDSARKLIAKMKKSGKRKALAKDLNVPDEGSHGQTVMHYCAAQNFVEFLVDLADLGASIDNPDDRGFTPLHLAATHGRTSAVTALLRKGADPNISAHAGDTPLHYACQHGHAPVVEALVVEHSNCTMLNVSGHTSLDVACQSGHAQVVAILLKSGQYTQAYLQRSDMPHSALLLAAKSGNNDVIALLVNHGFNVNRKLQGYNGSCLHEAVLYGKVDTVRYLLQCGADLHLTNNQGLTPLEIVQMYTDPRSAGQMKQVLQDGLAQGARARIAQNPQGGPPQQQQRQQQQQPQQQQHAYQQPQAQYQRPQYQQQASQPPSQGFHHTQHQAGSQDLSLSGGKKAPPPPGAVGGAGFNYLMAGAAGTQLRKRSESTSSQHQQEQGYKQPQQPQQLQYQQQQQQQTYQQQAYQQQQQAYQQQQQAYQQQQTYQQQQSLPQQQQQQAAFQQSRQHSVGTAHADPSKRNSSGSNPSDLASMIAAKIASRKPMAASPTRKDFPPIQAEIQQRSQTNIAGMETARRNSLRRRNSLTGKSDTPEVTAYDRSTATLPRHADMGPPEFKPVPPSEGTPGPVIQTSAVPKLRKTAPRPPPQEPSVNNELFKKLQRRQDRIQKAEDVGVDSEVVEPQEGERLAAAEEEGSAPPPPERKTSSLNLAPPLVSAPPPPTSAPPSSAGEPPKSSGGAPPPAPKTKPKAKPPPTRPKQDNDVPSGMPNWQAELLHKKQEAERQQQLEEERKAEEEKRQVEEEERLREEAELAKLEEARIAEETRVKAEQERLRVEKERKAEEEKKRRAEARKKAAEDRKKAEEEQMRQEEEVRQAVERRRRINAGEPVESAEERKQKMKEEVEKRREEEEMLATKEKEEAMKREAEETRRKEEEARRLEEEAQKREKEEVARVTVLATNPVIAPPKEFSAEPSEITPAPVPNLIHTEHPPAPTVHHQQTAAPPMVAKKPDDSRPKEATSVVLQETSTPNSEMSRSTSLSSIPTTASGWSVHVTEPIPIADWLSSYKLNDYVPLFEAAGYNTTDFLQSITSDDLVEIGVTKPGHKKKILSALSSLRHKEHLIMSKPYNVSSWLTLLELGQYDQNLIEAGYDDINFISDISCEDLEDIGITKKGHLRRFMRGIAELMEVMKSSPNTPTLSSLHMSVSAKLNNVVPPLAPSQAPAQVDAAGGEPDSHKHHHNDIDLSATPTDMNRVDESQPQGPHPSKVPQGVNNNDVGMGTATFIRMRSLLAMQLAGSTLDVPDGQSVSPSPSPSHSPVVSRRKARGAAHAPSPPKRGAHANRHSYSSSSSISSNQSEHMGRPQDCRSSVQIPLTDQNQLGQQDDYLLTNGSPKRTAHVEHVVNGKGADRGEGMGKKTFSVEDITSALDEMVENSQYLSEAVAIKVSQSKEDEADHPTPQKSMVQDELDALQVALQGFPAMSPESERNVEESDELLTNIDNMLAHLNKELDILLPNN